MTSPRSYVKRAEAFCTDAPYRDLPYSKRNWGGLLHSLCSYQGKLKPSIAHFLVKEFTSPGDRVLDPMSGVGTIPLEARRQQRVAIGSDLSPLAYTVTRAKVEPVTEQQVWSALSRLEGSLAGPPPAMAKGFGFNGPIESYFHPDTFDELLLARAHFAATRTASDAGDSFVFSNLLHILHGNRPYALSRRSHPVTPFAPSGPTPYKSVLGQLKARLDKAFPAVLELNETSPAGAAYECDFRALEVAPVDAVITSPPFVGGVRFWSSNWMRLWLAGWSADSFTTEPGRFLESEQKASFEVYREFALAMHQLMRPGAPLILHLGETARTSMSTVIQPMLGDWFKVQHVGVECVRDTESHGLRDKGATIAHSYVFATAR